MTRVLLSDAEGGFASALAPMLEARGLELVAAEDGAAEIPEGISALIVSDLVPALMVQATPPGPTDQPLPDRALDWIESLIAAAGKAGTPRVVLVSAASVPPGLVPPPALRAAERLENAMARACADRAVILRVADILDPEAPGLQQAVRTLVETGAGHWPAGDRMQGVAIGDLAAAAAGAVTARDVAGKWFDIAAPEAIARPTVVAEAQRLAALLSDPSVTEVQARPPYPPAALVRDGTAGRLSLHCPPFKTPWTVLAETVQQLVLVLGKEGKLPRMLPPMPEVHRALETGSAPLSGKTVVLTGATAGIGRAAAHILVQLGAEVIGVGRTAEAGTSLAEEITAERDRMERLRARHARIAARSGRGAADAATAGAVGHFRFEQCDLSDLEQLRALAAKLVSDCPRIHALVNNAGAVLSQRKETPQHIEATLAINLIAPVTLTRLLADPLLAAAKDGGARVVNVGSDAHYNAPLDMNDLQSRGVYNAINVYGRAKSGLVMMTRALAEVMQGSGVSITTVSPGLVRTDILNALQPEATGGPSARQRQNQMRQQAQQNMISPEQGAMHVVDVLVSPEFQQAHGGYVSTDKVQPAAPHTEDRATTQALWQAVAQMGGLPA
ncbi:MAG: SDR family NAD(P)-dependent oxidoreductase [Paracoccaceae bacterium]